MQNKISVTILIKQAGKSKNKWVLTPLFGTVVYLILYTVATFLYPGGSQADKNSIGFSWKNNYWCNLLYDTAINGQPNSAEPFAISGMFLLCMTLTFFWFVFPQYAPISKKLGYTIQISGTIAMVVAAFLFTSFNHDFIINLASVFGLIATVGVFIGLYKMRWFWLFALGLSNVVFIAFNNYFYYTKGLIIYLPIIQKISFAVFLLWICCVDIQLYKETEKKAKAGYKNYP